MDDQTPRCEICGETGAAVYTVQVDETDKGRDMQLCYSCVYDMSGSHLIDGQ